MIDAEYRREMNHNYLILKKEGSTSDFYVEKMICENEIPGLLPCRIRSVNEAANYYYDITRKQTMYDIFQQKEMEEKDLRVFLIKLNQLFGQMEGYLLPDDGLILSPRYIYWNYETFELFFCYYPSHKGSIKETFVELAEFVIEKTDHEKEELVELAYSFYQNIMEENYEISIFVQDYIIDREAEETPYEPEIRIPKEEYYFREPEEEEEYIEEAPTGYTRIMICAGITFFAVSMYLMVLFRPSILTIIGLGQRDYIKIGGVIGIIFAGVILGTMSIYSKRKDGNENSTIEKEKEENREKDIYIDWIEEKAFYSKDDTQEEYYGDTVLLTDEKESMGEGRKTQGVPCLLGEYLYGDVLGKEIKLIINKNPYIIGKLSKNADGILEDKKISRIHASIREENNRYYLSDLNSTNGTSYNGRRLEIGETVELSPFDKIRLADIILTFRYISQESHQEAAFIDTTQVKC